MTTALFIGLEKLLGGVKEHVGPHVRIIHQSFLDGALKIIETTAVELVVIPSVFDQRLEGGIAGVLDSRHPPARTTVILIDITNPRKGLTILEQKTSGQGRTTRTSPLRELKEEISRVCRLPAEESRPRIRPDLIQEVKSIGFYDCVELRGRSIHVQTEIYGSETIRIRTTVLEGGTIRDTAVQLFPSRVLQDIAEVSQMEEIVRAQHRKMVEDVQNGKYI